MREWFDIQHVDALMDVAASATALAAIEVAKTKNKIVVLSGPGATRITNEACTPIIIGRKEEPSIVTSPYRGGAGAVGKVSAPALASPITLAFEACACSSVAPTSPVIASFPQRSLRAEGPA